MEIKKGKNYLRKEGAILTLEFMGEHASPKIIYGITPSFMTFILYIYIYINITSGKRKQN